MPPPALALRTGHRRSKVRSCSLRPEIQEEPELLHGDPVKARVMGTLRPRTMKDGCVHRYHIRLHYLDHPKTPPSKTPLSNNSTRKDVGSLAQGNWTKDLFSKEQGWKAGRRMLGERWQDLCNETSTVEGNLNKDVGLQRTDTSRKNHCHCTGNIYGLICV